METSVLSSLSREHAAFVVLLAALLGGVAALYLRRVWFRLKMRRRFAHGIRSEGKAGKILRRHGYVLVKIQQPIRASIIVNGKKRGYDVCPDGFAKRRSRYFAVEVKTGKVAVNPLFRETRRQMLEYYHFSSVDGVLLVNADKESVKLISFERNGGWSVWWIVVLAILCGVVYVAL